MTSSEDREPHFRANVGLAVRNDRGQVLALERWPAGSGRWQMAQGGLDPGEEPEQAAYRELREELGLGAEDVQLIATHDHWLTYELPRFARIRPGGLGQAQKWFLFRLLTGEDRIDLGSESSDHRPELVRWRWARLDQLAEQTWEPRRHIYRQLAHDWSAQLLAD